MAKILISTSSFNTEANPYIQKLADLGYTIQTNPYKRRMNEDEITQLLQEDVVGLIAGLEPLTKKVLRSSQLRCISRVGIGIDNIDLEEAKSLEIAIHNTPDAPTESVAEYTLALMFACLRYIPQHDNAVREQTGIRFQGRLLSEQTVGLIGFGRIGRSLAAKLQALGANVIIHDDYVEPTKDFHFTTLDELLKRADIVSLHIPQSTENQHLLNEKRIAMLKENCILINSARGGLIDEDALYQALSSKKIAMAAIDVFAEEPYAGPLSTLENTILSPHIASLTDSARSTMERLAAKSLYEALNNP